MAEDLGQAQLTLTVNLDKFRDDLRNAKRLVASELGDAGIGGSGSRRSSPQRSSEAAAEARAQRARERRVRDEQRELARRSRQGGARENTRALEIAQEKRFRIARRIDDLEERGADVARLRNRLGQLTEAQSKRQFGTFRQIGQELARQVTLEERRVGAQRRQQRAAQAQARIGARNGGASESITALEDAQDRRFRLSQRINRLEERGIKVDKLRTQLGNLTTSYANRQFGTAKQLSRELGRQVTLTEARARREREAQQAIDRRTKAEQAATARSARLGGPRSPIQGSRSIPDSPAFLDAQRKQQARDLARAARIGGPSEPIRGRKDLEGSPAFIREQVKRSTDIYKRFVEQQARELTRAARAGGPAEPIKGRIDLPGSPAAIQAEQKARVAAEREEQRRRREQAARLRAQRAEELRIARGNTSPVSGMLPGGVRIPGSPAAKGRELDIRNNWKVFLDQLVETKEAIDQASAKASAQLKGPALPVSGRLINGQVVPGSPADLQQRAGSSGAKPRGPALPISGRLPGGGAIAGSPAAAADAERKLGEARRKVEADTRRLARQETKRTQDRRKRVGEAVGNAIIGGAFPALFGQGIGASIGGGVGGGLGGLLGGNFGFGLSLVGTAFGQAVDTALQQFADLGAAINTPVKNFSALQEAALLSSRGLERNVEGLIAAGRYAEANAVIQADLASTFGDLSTAERYRDQVDQLNRAWAQGTTQLAAFVAGPLTELIKRTRLAIGGTPQNNEERELQQQQRSNVADTFTKVGLGVASIGGAAALTPGLQLPGLATLGIGGLLTGIGRLAGQGGGNPADEDLRPLVEATNRAVEARAKSLDLAKAERQQIVALAQGNRDAADAAERTAAALRRDEAIATDPTQSLAAWREYEKTIVGINERQKQREKELTQTVQQEAIKRNQIAQQIGATRARRDAALAQADSAANPGNTTLAGRAGELEGLSFLAQNRLRVEQAITSERLLQAQYAQESDPTKRAQLAEQITSASYELRLAGEEAGAALAEKAASAAESLRSAQETLRGTLQSNFNFLPRDQRQGLLDSARDDIERGRRSGILRPNFGAAGRRRIFAAADFVRNVEQQRGQVAQQQALVDALKENTNAERNIRINVTVNADGSFGYDQTEQQAALL